MGNAATTTTNNNSTSNEEEEEAEEATTSISFAPATLWMFPLSAPSMAVMLLKDMANLDGNIEVQMVDLMKGEKCKENPLGTCPYLRDNQSNFKVEIGEGAAILVHLCETRKLTQFYPVDPTIRAKVNYWMHWHHTGTRKVNVVLRKSLDPKTTTKVIIEEVKDLLSVLYYLDLSLKHQGTKFLACDQITIADIFLIPEIETIDAILDACFQDGLFPHLDDWRKRMALIPQYQKIIAPLQQFTLSDFYQGRIRWLKDAFIDANFQEKVLAMHQAIFETGEKNSDTNTMSIQDLDLNNDGNIDFREYRQYLQSAS